MLPQPPAIKENKNWPLRESNTGTADITGYAWAQHPQIRLVREKKTGSFSLIERVILSAGAMLIFSVSFQIDQMPEGNRKYLKVIYIGNMVM